ncbi:hypothetical protein BDY24DRAFT_376538 [Mrakia frigida]|uniref:uncharacterized protein n=1 Tax=Mrakia frigida TaxID=29902 RepID=UPI003FCC12C8
MSTPQTTNPSSSSPHSSSSSSSSPPTLYEVSLFGLIPSSSSFPPLISKLNSLSLSSSPFDFSETVMRPIVPPEGAKKEDGVVRVRVIDGKSYLTVLSRPESIRTAPLALVSPVIYSLVVGGGADAEDVAAHLGFQKAYAFTKRGIAFTLANQLRVEVFKLEKEGENEKEEEGYMVEVRSIPIPHSAVATVVEQEMEVKRNLVGLVDLKRVDG